MTTSRLGLTLACCWVLAALSCRAAELPKEVKSAPCAKPPTIDGVLKLGEWEGAEVYRFEMAMLRVMPAGKAEARKCTLRLMNSANGLYVALEVPDATLNDSLSPLDMDLALLAFCRGKELAAGDDRKAIAPGLYQDKHFLAPGKDEADSQQDGRGACTHSRGAYVFEWAVPLDSADKHDLKARPGDKVLCNVCYFDGFAADLSKTEVGVIYGNNFDRADTWGTLELAAEVKRDDGSAFEPPAPPAWVEELFAGLKQAPANRLVVKDVSPVPGLTPPAFKVVAEFRHLDAQGKEKTGRAKLFLPNAVRDGKTRVPLYHAAGYELADPGAVAYLRQGFAVCSPSQVEVNPLVQTVSPDVALLHIARSLPFVDDGRVVIGGGSAGGYATLMLAAETFPLAGALPDVPPVNLGYNAAYYTRQAGAIREHLTKDGKPRAPFLAVILPLMEQCAKVYGDDPDDRTWYHHSPVSQCPTITCPVSVVFSTADVLVPVDQLGRKWVKAFDPQEFPKGFATDPDKLMTSREGRRRLLDVLDEKDYEVFEVALTGPQVVELPVGKKQWSIVVLDEGAPEASVGHYKYPTLQVTRKRFLDGVLTGKVPASQLTPVKLERLMDRYAGQEWLPTRLKHLDLPESERADVLRGLRLYVGSGPENARAFAELYDKLPEAKRVLEPGVLKGLRPPAKE
jgi:hypothetical protein